MTIEERLVDDLKGAMRSGDELRRSVIRLVRAALQNEQIAKRRELDDAAAIEVLSRMTRQYREAIESYRQGNRPDRAEQEERELAVVMGYMPQQLSRDEVRDAAQRTAEEVGAGGPADRGKVMGALMPQLRGKADGSVVNEVVTELLESMASSP